MSQQPLYIGSVNGVAHYLGCSRTTVWRRMKDRPDCFRRLSRSIIVVINLLKTQDNVN